MLDWPEKDDLAFFVTDALVYCHPSLCRPIGMSNDAIFSTLSIAQDPGKDVKTCLEPVFLVGYPSVVVETLDSQPVGPLARVGSNLTDDSSQIGHSFPRIAIFDVVTASMKTVLYEDRLEPIVFDVACLGPWQKPCDDLAGIS